MYLAAVDTRFVGPDKEKAVLPKETDERNVLHGHKHLDAATPALSFMMSPCCGSAVANMWDLRERRGLAFVTTRLVKVRAWASLGGRPHP